MGGRENEGNHEKEGGGECEVWKGRRSHRSVAMGGENGGTERGKRERSGCMCPAWVLLAGRIKQGNAMRGSGQCPDQGGKGERARRRRKGTVE